MGREVREQEVPIRAAPVFPVLLLVVLRYSLHKGFVHKRTENYCSKGWLPIASSTELTLHNSRWRHGRRMDAGKDASIRKRDSCYK